MSDVRRRLDDLKATAHQQPARPTMRRHDSPSRLEDVLGGREVTDHEHRYWLVERSFDEVVPDHEVHAERLARSLLHESGFAPPVTVALPRTLVVDIETGGFSGTPVFLIGLVPLDRRPLRVIQLLARDYPEEEAILHGLARLTADRDTWVTFNGKSFDEPFLRDRATLHRVHLPTLRFHVDLLHAARRAWGADLPNCRLGTLEEHILGRPRVGDVPSSDVPDLFHHFIRTRNAAPLRAVLEHNQIDLVSSTELLLRLSKNIEET